MKAARAKADADVGIMIDRVEEEVVNLLGEDKFLNAPDLGGKFRGYRVGDGPIFASLPPRQPKLAISANGLLVVATLFGETHHVQRAPHSMRQSRILVPYAEAMRMALERHCSGCEGRGAQFRERSLMAHRIMTALSQ